MPFFLKTKKNLIILSVLILFHLVLISIQIPLGEGGNYFEKVIFSILSPMQHGVVSFFRKIGELWNGYFDLRDVQSQNEKMRKEIFDLSQKNHLLMNFIRKLESENEIQDALQDMYKSILPAHVISLDFSNYFKSIIINRGSLDGIRKDMLVLDRYGYLVGRIIGPISLKEAKVQLITDNDSGTSVFTQEKEIWGMLTGDGKGQCLLKYILMSEEKVRTGERVFTSGYDGIYPKGIDVGKIVSIEKTTDLFKKIIVKPYFEFRNLDQLAVIRINFKELF